MSLLKRLFDSKPDPREGLRPLWHAVVAEARLPAWYASGGVADTVSGRFDMICAVLAAVLVRMEASDHMANESVFLTELFVHDMDGQLREFGVGDVVVGKHVGKLVGAMGGRLAAYRAGLAADDSALQNAVERNISFREGGDPAQVVRRLRAFAEQLSTLSDERLLAGDIAP